MSKYSMLKALTDKKLKIALMLGVLLLTNLGMVLGSPAEDADLVKLKLACLICRIVTLFLFVAGGIAALVIVIAGIRWVGSGEDPGARTAAKSSIISAIVGLIIIVLAVYLVTWLVTSFGEMQRVNLINWLIDGCGGEGEPGTICGATSMADLP
jgi:hypothetical protein